MRRDGQGADWLADKRVGSGLAESAALPQVAAQQIRRRFNQPTLRLPACFAPDRAPRSLTKDGSPLVTLSTKRCIGVMAAYGFVAGLPLPLSTFTLRYWLSDGGVPLAAIGLTANIGLAYSLKFLWAPLLDQIRPPGPLRRLGQRRGWLAVIQPGLVLAAVLLALSNPVGGPAASIAAAALVAFLSASQDIVVDAWRIELFPPRLQGAALAAYVWGYRLALLIATSGVIAASGRIGWHAALLGVAALIAIGPLVTMLAPEPARISRPAIVASAAERLRQAVVAPLQEFLSRPGAGPILAFVALFKLGEAMAGIMTAPFYRALGFARDSVAATGPFSLVATLLGISFGGVMVARIGVGRALLWTGVAQTAAMAMYVLLAGSPNDQIVLFATVSVEAFAQGMADAAFLTYLSGLCSLQFTATHYALLSSVPALAIHTIGGVSGVLAGAVGWHLFYGLCMFAALPAMGLMLFLLRRHPPIEQRR
jgi:PAT family beta-lactamase induction signal transducer AmpG